MVWTAPAAARIKALAAAGAEELPSVIMGRVSLGSGSIFEAPTLVSCFEDMTVVGEPIEQSGCHFGVAKHICPFAKAQVGGDNDAGLLIELAEQMEQQRTARWTKRQIAQLIKDHEIDGGVEPRLFTAVRDGLHC